MVHRQVTRHDPIDLHSLVNFINAAPHKLKGHGFHDKHLDLSRLQNARPSDLLEREAPLIFAAVEQELEEGQDANFLVQVAHFFHNGWES